MSRQIRSRFGSATFAGHPYKFDLQLLDLLVLLLGTFLHGEILVTQVDILILQLAARQLGHHQPMVDQVPLANVHRDLVVLGVR